MNLKLAMVLLAYCLLHLCSRSESSFIKPNNVPRVGRSNEGVNAYDQGNMGYVIKTNKNIPRMGRRNYDSENRYDIPKFYQFPTQAELEDDQANGQGAEEVFYLPGGHFTENMKR